MTLHLYPIRHNQQEPKVIYSGGIPNLNAELERALSQMTHLHRHRLYDLGITPEIARKLLIGVMMVHIANDRFWPSIDGDKSGGELFVLPTNIHDGQLIGDLIATDGFHVWRRLGSDPFIGCQEPVYRNIQDWFLAGGNGCVFLGD